MSVEREMTRIMASIAEAMMRYIESSDVIPIDTHNLKDSTGVAVFSGGTLRKLLINQQATEPRRLGRYGEVWGRDIIQRVMDDGMMKYGSGYYIVLYSAMPYADVQDRQGVNQGWFSVQLAGQFESLVREVVKKYGVLSYEIVGN